jgi:hypothetical protein
MTDFTFKHFVLPAADAPSNKVIGFSQHQYARRKKAIVSLEPGARVGYGRDAEGLASNLDKVRALVQGCWTDAVAIEAFYAEKHEKEDEAKMDALRQRAQLLMLAGMDPDMVNEMLSKPDDSPEGIAREAAEAAEREEFSPNSHVRYVLPIAFAVEGTHERLAGNHWYALRCFEKATLANAEDLREYPLFATETDDAVADDVYRIKRSMTMGIQRLDVLLEVLPTITKDVTYAFDSAWDRLCAIVRKVQDEKPDLCAKIGKEIAELDLVKAKALLLRGFENHALTLMGDTALAVSKMTELDAGRVWANAMTQYLPQEARSTQASTFEAWVKAKRAAAIAMAQGAGVDANEPPRDPGRELAQLDTAALDLIDSGEIDLPSF